MRLFTAVLFEDSVKDSMMREMERLRASCRGGNFTLRENLHMTLVFLGEVDRKGAAGALGAVRSVSFPEFFVEFDRIGRFRRRDGGDLYWMGIVRSPELERAEAELEAELRAAGLDFEGGRFSPHVTLARQVAGGGLCGPIEPFSARVSRVSLMRSERIDGVLSYSEVK